MPLSALQETLKFISLPMSRSVFVPAVVLEENRLLDRKRQEGKHYYVYMTAAANKFLRIYYGSAMAYLEKL